MDKWISVGYPRIQHGHGKRFSTSETSSSLSLQFVQWAWLDIHSRNSTKHCCVITMLLFDDPSITMSLFHDPPHYCGLSHAMAGHGRPFLWSIFKAYHWGFPQQETVAEAATNCSKSFAFASVSPARCLNGAKLWPDLQKCPWSKRVSDVAAMFDDTGGYCI